MLFINEVNCEKLKMGKVFLSISLLLFLYYYYCMFELLSKDFIEILMMKILNSCLIEFVHSKVLLLIAKSNIECFNDVEDFYGAVRLLDFEMCRRRKF